MPTHIELSSKLLMDAANFFRQIASQNPEQTQEMNQNADMFERVSAMIQQNPHLKINDIACTEIAGKYLINAARFFTHISEQKHDEVKQQMLENADVYLHIGHLITVDPEGMLDE